MSYSFVLEVESRRVTSPFSTRYVGCGVEEVPTCLLTVDGRFGRSEPRDNPGRQVGVSPPVSTVESDHLRYHKKGLSPSRLSAFGVDGRRETLPFLNRLWES